MGKYEDSVDIILSARNEATAQLRQAEQQQKEAAGRQRRLQREQQRENERLEREAAQKEVQRQRFVAEERKKVEAETRDATLRASGQHLEADLEQTRRSYNQRIRAALDANDMELADRIATLRDIRVAEQREAQRRGALVRNVMENQVVAAAVKATASFGLAELALGGVNSAAEVMSGNFEDAAEAVKQLPAGIGPFARQLETLLGSVTGIRQETEQLERITRNLEDAQRQRFESNMAGLRREAEAIRNRIQLEQEIVLLSTGDDNELQRLRARFTGLNRISDIEAEILETERNRAEFVAATAKEETERAEAIEKLWERQRKEFRGGEVGPDPEVLLEIGEEMRSIQALSAARREQIAEYNRRADALRESIPLVREINRLERENIEKGIEREKTAEAEREAENRIRIAEREAAEKVRIAEQEQKERARLEQERRREVDAQLAEARRQSLEQARGVTSEIQAEIAELRERLGQVGRMGQSTPTNTADQNRFLTGGVERSQENDRRREDREREAARNIERQIKALEEMKGGFEDLIRLIQDGPRIVGGVFRR